jgi:hypothetical protein
LVSCCTSGLLLGGYSTASWAPLALVRASVPAVGDRTVDRTGAAATFVYWNQSRTDVKDGQIWRLAK